MKKKLKQPKGKQSRFIDKSGEVRELTADDEDHIKLIPLTQKFPELAEWSAKRKAGRPKSKAPKRLQSFKLSPDVIEAIKATGPGYNVRVEMALRRALEEGRL